MEKPTCEDLLDSEGVVRISRDDVATWRHGVYRTDVYHRQTDNTFWLADYRVSTDGETHELREGLADISQVWPKEVVKTEYTTKNPNEQAS